MTDTTSARDGAGSAALSCLADLGAMRRCCVERFRAQTGVPAQSEIHPRARLKTVASI
jgi:flagellar biosynthesis protein FlhA